MLRVKSIPTVAEPNVDSITDYVMKRTGNNAFEASLIIQMIANRSCIEEWFNIWYGYHISDDKAFHYECVEKVNSNKMYHRYVDQWDNFMNIWGTKSLSEKAKALNVKTDNVESFKELFESGDYDKIAYVGSHIRSDIRELNAVAIELRDTDNLDVREIENLTEVLESKMADIYEHANEYAIDYELSKRDLDWKYYDNNLVDRVLSSKMSQEDQVHTLITIREKNFKLDDSLYDIYKDIDEERKNLNANTQATLDVGSILSGIGGDMVIKGIVSTFNPDNATYDAILITLGGVVLAGGIVTMSFGEVLSSISNTYSVTVDKFFKKYNNVHPQLLETNEYINQKIEQLKQ